MDTSVVEMSSYNRDSDMVVASDTFRNEPAYEPQRRRQNRLFGFMVLCVSLGTMVYLLVDLRSTPDEIVGELGKGDHGLSTSDTKEVGDKVAEAFANKKKKVGNGAANWGRNDDNNSVGDSKAEDKNSDDEVDPWLSAVVTLQDGVKFEIVDTLVHDSAAFTEGLAYKDGLLYESTGLKYKSTVRTLNPTTGEVMNVTKMDPSIFGEGLTLRDKKLVQLTYKKKKGFVYDSHDLSKPPKSFKFDTTTGEGWGMTYNEENDEFVVSDGSQYLLFWDGETYELKRKLPVSRQSGKPAKRLNELEWWNGRILANVWFQDILLVINPDTGIVEKEYDFSTLWPQKERQRQGADVFNGISVSQDHDVLYVTGKLWDRMFKVKLLV